MQLIIILTIQISLILVGVLAAVSMGVKRRLEILGLSYLLGSGIMTILFLLLHWFFGLKLDQLNFLFSFALSIIFLLIINILLKRMNIIKNLFKFKFKNWFSNMSSMKRSIFFVILLLSIYGFFENYFWPIVDWDALAFYDFRALVMSKTGSMMEGKELDYFFQYPPYTSFLHVFGYIFGAERVRIVYSLIYSSLLLTFYNLVKRKQTTITSLFSTLILASTPIIFEHSTIAYSNLAFTTYFSLGIIYLWFYIYEKSVKDLIVGSFLVGISTWIRSTEPFWIVALILIVWGYFKHKTKIIPSIFLSYFLALPNKIWRNFLDYLDTISTIKFSDTRTHSIQAILLFFHDDINFYDLILRAFEVTYYLISVLNPVFSLLSLLYLVTVLNDYRNKIIESITIFLLLAIVWGGTYIFSFTFETWNMIGGSIVRMCMIFIPLLIFIIVKDLKYQENK